MGLGGGIVRTATIPLLLLNLAFAIIIVGLTAHFLDKEIAGKYRPDSTNGAARFFVLLSLVAAAVAIASYIMGLTHLKTWRRDSSSGAQSAAWIAFLLLVLAFCLAWKQIHIGHRPVKVRVAEAFVIMLTVTHFIYTILTHLGDHGDNTTGTPHHKPGNPNAPAAASAV